MTARCDWAACPKPAVRHVDGYWHCGHHLTAHLAEFHPQDHIRALTAAEQRLEAQRQQHADRQLAEAILDAGYLGFSRAELTGPGRSRELVRARQELMVALHDRLGLGLSEVGRLFRRDHTTVIHARRRIHEQAAS